MTRALVKRIEDAFGLIYDQGDNGLEYMDGHTAVDSALMEHFYNDTLDQLSKAQLTQMALMLESIANDMDMDLEVL